MLLPRRDRKLLWLMVVAQLFLALVDLVAVLAIGLVGLVATGAAEGTSVPQADRLLDALGLGGLEPLAAATLISVVAGLLLVTKSILSFLLVRRIFRFLATRQASISGEMARGHMSRPLQQVQSRSSQDLAFALTLAINNLTFGILGQGVVVVAEVTLLLVLGIGLFFVDPVVTLFSLAFFGVIALVLQKVVGGTASRIGLEVSRGQIASTQAIQNLLDTYRESVILGRRDLSVKRFTQLRRTFADNQARTQVIFMLSKYAFEVALVIGGGALAASQFLTQDLTAAIAIIAVFLVASSRILPSLNRLQSALLAIRSSSGNAQPALSLAQELRDLPRQEVAEKIHAEIPLESVLASIEGGYPDFTGSIECRDLVVTYETDAPPALNHVSLSVDAGSSLAIVGPSGAGKSTLADTLLGLIEPDHGSALVSGMEPRHVLRKYPGAIGYIPQVSNIIEGDIRTNVALGIPVEDINDDLVWEALERAHLASFLRQSRNGLSTPVGENGVTLSGGQRQRLGIARALYSQPKMVVLDEATSSLDAETELAVSQTLKELEGEVTVVVVAHRLATVRDSDLLVYLQSGRVMGMGSFDEVRHQVEAFDRQARLMGL